MEKQKATKFVSWPTNDATVFICDIESVSNVALILYSFQEDLSQLKKPYKLHQLALKLLECCSTYAENEVMALNYQTIRNEIEKLINTWARKSLFFER